MVKKPKLNDKTREPLTPASGKARIRSMSDKRKASPTKATGTPVKPAPEAAPGNPGPVKVRSAAPERAKSKPVKPPAAKTGKSKAAKPRSSGAAKTAHLRGEVPVPASTVPASAGPVKRRTGRTRKAVKMSAMSRARFAVGEVVRHKYYPFRGVIFDIDPVFANTEEWWQAIPEKMRPRKNQPFYHLLAENAETEYIAYVSEQNLLPDTSGLPVRHPQVAEYFTEDEDGRYRPVFMTMLN